MIVAIPIFSTVLYLCVTPRGKKHLDIEIYSPFRPHIIEPTL